MATGRTPKMANPLGDERMVFEELAQREVVARFDGGTITSDAGGLLLREVDHKVGVLESFAGCFIDHRDPRYTHFTVRELLAQRVFGLALGYEDLNDHDQLRKDPLLGTLAERPDPTGQDRARKQDRGNGLAGKSTLNRLELTPKGAPSRYKKIEYCEAEIEEFFVTLFLRCHKRAPKRIVIDLDATNDPVHGGREGRFFHGYYDQYCYLPLYAFCGDFVLCAKLRTADKEAADGSLEVAQRLEARIHARWPHTEILFRADSGFARDAFMNWCETHPSRRVHYVFGLAKNSRLLELLEPQMRIAEQEFAGYQERVEETRTALEQAGLTKTQIQQQLAALDNPSRRYCEFQYATRDTWTRQRRVIAKAEYLEGGRNPRFVVTSLPNERYQPRPLYEDVYCARGDMENRIKENQRHLFADRTSTQRLRSNQLRLSFSAVAYMLIVLIRRFGLKGTKDHRAQCQTIRTKLFKIGAQVIVSVRRVSIRFATGYPFQQLFMTVLRNLQRMPYYARS